MDSFVQNLREVGKGDIGLVGGKGANIGELFKIESIHVPEGFCVNTGAFKKIISDASIKKLLDALSVVGVDDRPKITELCAQIRALIEGTTIPGDIRKEIIAELSAQGDHSVFAIRSSATAEDLPQTSFAGQQDSYLNIAEPDSILAHISKCWASLYTDRAVIYRKQNGFDSSKVYLCVIVQKMVLAQASGILFTADPVTNNRRVISIDAAVGTGENLVAGVVQADAYKVENDKVISKNIVSSSPVLTREQIMALSLIGRKIEKHFGYPQDIEWCLADEQFYVVQSRPITTLYPVPARNDHENHLYVSVGHQQMMTDAMKPLGLSFWKLTAGRPMYEAGGRLFVDIANELASPEKRNVLVNVFGKYDPLIKDALITFLQRDSPKEFVDNSNQDQASSQYDTLKDYNSAIVDELVKRREASVALLKDEIQTKSGPGLIDFILDDLQHLRKSLSDPQSFGVFMTAMNASSWINEKMNEWLGEKNVADTLSLSVPNNVTSEMGLSLLDVADAIRMYPDVVEYLQRVKNDKFLDELPELNGGREAVIAINHFLDKYGMRCTGEIDITKTRWSEKPITLVPLILSNIKSFAPGESKRRFESGRRAALKKEDELLSRLENLPGHEQKVKETKRMIGLLRNLIGYREYPKYHMICRYYYYKEALLKEARRLTIAGIIQEKEDVFYLTLEELRELMVTNKIGGEIIRKRRDQYKVFEKLTPPRVMTSDGEIITGKFKRDNLPANTITGLAVSTGVVEGRARVIFNMEDAGLEKGDILVTTFTDPSWTPLFVLIKGLVTEVGSLMSHGAVIAREYGIAAVVGVEHATKRIKDGQRIRVHGTEGYVEIL